MPAVSTAVTRPGAGTTSTRQSAAADAMSASHDASAVHNDNFI